MLSAWEGEDIAVWFSQHTTTYTGMLVVLTTVQCTWLEPMTCGPYHVFVIEMKQLQFAWKDSLSYKLPGDMHGMANGRLMDLWRACQVVVSSEAVTQTGDIVAAICVQCTGACNAAHMVYLCCKKHNWAQ